MQIYAISPVGTVVSWLVALPLTNLPPTMKFPFDTRILKFALAGGAAAYAVQLFTTGYVGSGVGMVILAALLTVTALRSVRLIMVAFRIQQQQLDKARAMLEGVNPKHLWSGQQGQYWFLTGNLLLESSLTEAEKAFRTALDVGMKRDEEKAAVMLNLAAIQSSKRRTKEAKALLAQAKRQGQERHAEIGHSDDRAGHQEPAAGVAPPLIGSQEEQAAWSG